jgi:hypothetical protein
VLNLAEISVIHPALFVNTKRKKNQAAIPDGIFPDGKVMFALRRVMLLRSDVMLRIVMLPFGQVVVSLRDD